jgi:enamine deaminase RidA (YjgF/YER057c/UK114 family)
MVFVSGLPPFDPESGEILSVPIERQTKLVLEQMKLCLRTAGTRALIRNIWSAFSRPSTPQSQAEWE